MEHAHQNDADMDRAQMWETQRVRELRCHRRTSFLLIARPPLASGSYGHKGKCQGLPRACVTRGYHRQLTVDRAFLVSNMHLGIVRFFQSSHERGPGRTEMPLLHSFWCLHINRVRLLDHMLAPSPGAHSRGANGIFLVPTQPRNWLGTIAVDTTDKHIPYRPSPLDHQGFWSCVLFMVEKKVLVHKGCKP